MNLYTMVGSGTGTPEGAALSARLATWHDAMVAHERRIRAGREDVCDEECPHAEARTLWMEALQVFGDRVQDLTFLRSRATGGSEPSEEVVVSADVRDSNSGIAAHRVLRLESEAAAMDAGRRNCVSQ
jgi:hypothetical protein